jgi:hypothetical protein
MLEPEMPPSALKVGSSVYPNAVVEQETDKATSMVVVIRRTSDFMPLL